MRGSSSSVIAVIALMAAPITHAGETQSGESGESGKTERPVAYGVSSVGQRDPLDPQGLGSLRVAGTGQVTSGTAFNPAISVILDGAYFAQSREGEGPAGFDDGHDHGHGHGHDHGHGAEPGFSLRETEVTFSATVDKYFDAIAVLAIPGTDGIEVEEAYITTRSLPAGLQIKAGRFLSDIGYINRQHPHDYSFVDRPLVNEFLFGDHGLQETGLQLSWIAPTPFYSRLGVEALQGTTSGIANYIGEGRHESVTIIPDEDDGTPVRLRYRDDKPFDDKAGPRLFTTFAKFAPDLGFDHAIQFGLSAGYARSFQREEAHSSLRFESWDGDARFYGVDLVYKYDAGRSLGHGNWTLQAEYFLRDIDIDYMSQNFNADGNLEPTTGGGTLDVFSGKSRQDGAYLQALYGFAPRWNVGLRAEGLGFTNRSLEPDRNNQRFESFGTSYRYTTQVSFMPTEFSRLRAQLAYRDFDHGDHGDDHDHGSWEFYLQYQISLGVHGAHDF